MLSPYGKTVAQGPSPGKPNRGMKAGPPVVRVLPRPPLGMSVRSHDWEPDRAYPYLSSPCLSARHAERKGKGRGLRAFIWPPVVARQGEGLRAYGTYIAKEFAMLVTDGFSAGARASSPAELPMCSGPPAGQDARAPMLRRSRPFLAASSAKKRSPLGPVSRRSRSFGIVRPEPCRYRQPDRKRN